IFQTVTKVELDFAASAASGQDFTELSEKIKAVMAPSIDNLYSGLMDELLPLDKPKRQDSILDMLKADVLGVILSEAGKPEKTEELLKAIAVKTSPDKAAAVEEAYRKHLYSGLMDELLPLDKPKRQDSILDMLKADVLGVILSEAGKPEKTEELLKAIAVKTSPDKAAAVEEAYRKHAKENADRQSK